MPRIIFLIISMVVFYGGTIFFQLTCASLNSLSVSQYNLPEKYWIFSKRFNWTFVVFTWGYSFPMIVYCHTELMLFSGLSIMCVGIANQFRQSDTITWEHQIFAAVGIILSQISLIVDYGNHWMWAVTLGFTAVMFLIRNKYGWWMKALEIFVCSAVFYTLISKK